MKYHSVLGLARWRIVEGVDRSRWTDGYGFAVALACEFITGDVDDCVFGEMFYSAHCGFLSPTIIHPVCDFDSAALR